MDILNLLFVEDTETQYQTFEQTLTRYCSEYPHRQVNITRTKSLKETQEVLKNRSFDGAIIDLRLENDSDAGNKLLFYIIENSRIPVAIYTANPENVDKEITDRKIIDVFRRGDVYDLPLNFLFEIFETGLTKIFGGRGSIENRMNRVFWENIIPNFEIWKTYKSQGKNTEDALLRFIINHIVELVDEEEGKYFPQEMYISPVIASYIKTGCIVKKRNIDQYYVVLNPACDLALHDGKMKTDRILLCFIEPANSNSLIKEAKKNHEIEILETDDEKKQNSKHAKMEKSKRILTQITTNTYSLYFHYLPKSNLFESGLINFRRIETYTDEDFNNNFETPPHAQISMTFTKDIISRFSNYYARQGQPDFDLDDLLKTLLE